ncbi:MAG: MMPL family transporter, partial [Clostridia bacterium]|nr:MMPL family transporter [Clostridia bacterium]
EGPLTKDLVEIAGVDFKITTVISIAAVMIIIALCLKSFSLPFVLVLSIELAIMINEGLTVITGSKVPFIAPAVIGCVQLGATVDYAILLTNRYKQELANGFNRRKAMLIAANASDYSIFKSVLVFFSATFSVYLISDVDIVKDLCMLLARGSVISGLIIIFLMTPLLVTLQKAITGSTIDFERKIVSKGEIKQ